MKQKIIKLFKKIKLYNLYKPFKLHLIISLVISLLILITVQSFECQSLVDGLLFVFNNTFFFIVNYLLIFFTVSLCFLFKKRMSVLLTIVILLLILGVSNFIIVLCRPMPLSAVDFNVLSTAKDILPHYLTPIHVILIIIGVVGIISGFIFLMIRGRSYNRNLKQAVLPPLCSGLLLIIFIIGGNVTGSIRISYNDVKAAYDNHGFIYCFVSSFISRGISKPVNYSPNEIEQIMDKYSENDDTVNSTPNIIIVQLESFLDTDKYDKYSLASDPIPNFHKICDENGQGALYVPSNGGGTVNTEFEVLTGMNLENFRTIEYPYTTVLKDVPCESAPFILDNYGYTSHAVHNHTGVFYARNEVYPNLGFDTFTPIEFMNDYTHTDAGWAKDDVILDSIKRNIDSTKGSDFIFAVTVQGHGSYADENDPSLKHKLTDESRALLTTKSDEKKANMYESYCNLISQTDEMIGELYDYVMSSDEEFIVVLYGDHLPALDFNSDYYEYRSDYMTTYTVFSNMDDYIYTFENVLPAYRLTSTLFDSLGINRGIINMINRHHNEINYATDMEKIQYDMLYGKGYAYKGQPYNKKIMKFGCEKIVINEVIHSPGIGLLTLIGENFTPDSIININGSDRATTFVDSTTLTCSYSKKDPEDIISVCQTAVDGTSLLEIFP